MQLQNNDRLYTSQIASECTGNVNTELHNVFCNNNKKKISMTFHIIVLINLAYETNMLPLACHRSPFSYFFYFFTHGIFHKC